MRKLLFLLLIICFGCSSIHKNIDSVFYLKNDSKNVNSIKNKKFTLLKDDRISYKNGVYWFKVLLTDKTKGEEELIFQVEEPSIATVAVYNKNELLTSEKSTQGNTVIILKLKNPKESLYYVRVHFKRQVHFPLNVYTTSQFYKTEEKKNLGFGLYYGIAIMVFILNIIFYISLKDNTFLYYSIFMGCINISFTAFDGVAYLYFSQVFFDDYIAVFHILIQIFGALFASNFLGLKFFYPKLDLFGKLFIVVPTTFYAIYYFTNNFLYFAIADFLGLLVLAYYWFMGILMYKKEEFAKFFVIGYCMALFAAIFYLTPLNFGLTSITATFNQLKFGNIIEMLVLTYAITYRVKKLQEENNSYRNELQLYLNELYGLKEQLKNATTTEKENSLNAKIEEIKISYNLTEREVDILIKITEGFTNKQIAENLFISVNTVKYHTRNLYEKLDIKKRTEISSKIIFDK
ncbi:7TM diverse intracellular signaling domain-containing protein [Polaribacter porphyrae]|uniref:HTH luxR-type domain-containing protein n=1 Tax=Polaribacter porphyrae TaxID=1137780 RepID=A0A2S7WT03_9FLAO|nr:7TM diverse intracellular signaling domain-containing protein [Polaribacter porphyrae]PQJ80735.1 hypothetical protein BTO18_16845 [Polaribacter porphyrae]